MRLISDQTEQDWESDQTFVGNFEYTVGLPLTMIFTYSSTD